MDKKELAKILKPLIKECVKEVLFEEDGALSHVISECLKSTGALIVEQEREASSRRALLPESLMPAMPEKRIEPDPAYPLTRRSRASDIVSGPNETMMAAEKFISDQLSKSKPQEQRVAVQPIPPALGGPVPLNAGSGDGGNKEYQEYFSSQLAMAYGSDGGPSPEEVLEYVKQRSRGQI